MTRDHNYTLDYLDEATVADLAQVSVAALVSLDAQVSELKGKLKDYTAKLDAACAAQFHDSARMALVGSGRDTGTVHLDRPGWDVTVTVPKKVDWDQEKLKAALDAMPPEEAKHYAKVKVEVDERKYTAAPPAIQKLLESARTVRPGKPTFSFKSTQEEAA